MDESPNRVKHFLLMLALVLFASGYLVGWKMATPNCPEEDSCSINYYHGKWHIEEVTP